MRLRPRGAGGGPKKLAATVRLILFHPDWANRSCNECRRFIYLEDGKPLLKLGRKVPRPRDTPTPCHKCPKIPDDAPARFSWHAVEPSEKSCQTYQHYRECRATGQFPDDPIVRRNAALIRSIEDAHARLPLVQIGALLGGKVR